MKFDYAILNPPFRKQLHLKFFKKSLDITKDNSTIICVHPSIWLFFKKADKTHPAYAKIINKIADYKKEFIFFNGNKTFGIRMFVPCCISIIDKANQDKKTVIIDELQKKTFEYADIHEVNRFGNYPEYYSLVDKIKAKAAKDNADKRKYDIKKHKTQKFNFYVNVAEIRGHVPYTRLGDIEGEGYWKSGVKLEKLNKSYAKKTQEEPVGMLSDDFYTIIPRSLMVETEVNKKIYFGFNSQQEADNFLYYVKTTFARFCLALVKANSQLNRGALAMIPWLDFFRKWTDADLRKEFNITDQEWNFICSVIPKYYEEVE
jgi:hypothetical protein